MTGPVVVITGASSGIGAALAMRLAGQGARIALVARRGDALDEVTARCGPSAKAIVADATRRAEVRRVASESVAHFGQVDVWVNNVGQGITRAPTELTAEDVDQMILVNVKSALYGMQEILPHFRARGTGHLINVSSLLGRLPYVPLRAAYTGAKHFLNALTASFRDEIHQTLPGVQVSLVSPGVVRTEFGVNAVGGGADSRQMPDSQSPEEVADVIAGVIASRRPDVYTRAGAQARIAAYYQALGADP